MIHESGAPAKALPKNDARDSSVILVIAQKHVILDEN